VKAIATMSDFKHSDLSVKLETFGERHSEKEWSFITVGANASKLLETELQRLERDPSMPLEILSCVKVYTSGAYCVDSDQISHSHSYYAYNL